jgi:hypothetical protein
MVLDAGVRCHDAMAAELHLTQSQKSFLLLFFKKEALAYTFSAAVRPGGVCRTGPRAGD